MHEVGVQSPDGITSSGADKSGSSLKHMQVSVKECFLTAGETNHDCARRRVQDAVTAHVG